MSIELAELKSRYDVVVVGARCAGAATAMLLARHGADVLLVDRDAYGADTLSTLALMRGGVGQLARWGLLDGVRRAGTPKIETTTFHYDREAVEIRIKPRDGADALYAPRRTVLDPLLADAAAAAGAHVIWRTRLRELLRDERGRVTGVSLEANGVERDVEANLIVGADGLHSTVAARLGAEPYRRGAHIGSVIFTFVQGLDASGYHWHFVPGAAAGVIPTGGGDVLVFTAASRERFLRELRHDLKASFYEMLHQVAPALGAAIRIASVNAPFRGFAGHVGYFRPAHGPGWALVGDAGYFKDPITAHGITDALRDAELLARAAERDTGAAYAEYQARRDELSLRLFEITDEIASYEWTLPRLQALHKSMSDEMAREAVFLRDLPDPEGSLATCPS